MPSLADIILRAAQPSTAERNAPYVAANAGPYATELDPMRELEFRKWVAENKVPFNPDATVPQDYDMRGFFQGLQQQNPKAHTAVNPNDNRLHFTDYWKTPIHESFSGGSKFAGPVAPMWNASDQLIAPSGRIMFDERRANGR